MSTPPPKRFRVPWLALLVAIPPAMIVTAFWADGAFEAHPAKPQCAPNACHLSTAISLAPSEPDNSTQQLP